MPADQRLRGVVHHARIERPRHMPDPIDLEAGRRAAVEDAVKIVALDGGEASAEGFRDHRRRQNGDRFRLEMGIRGVPHRVRPPFAIEVDMHHLMGGMNAGIGAAGAVDAHRLPGETSDCLLDGLLNRAPVGLELPPGKRRPVIFDDEHVARHLEPSS